MRTLVPMLALLGAAAACGRRAHDVPDAFRWEADLEPGTTLHLSTVSGRIDVIPVEGRSLRVSGSKHWVGRSDPVHFSSRRDGDDVYVCALWTANGNCTTGGKAFSGSGHSWLDMFSLFKRRATDVTASLHVALPAGVKVDARTLNGGISVVGATAGAIAKTLNGSINIERAAGSIEAKGTNGNIDVSLDSIGPDDPLVLESVNGSATAVVPANLDGEVRLVTVNGGVRSDFPINSDGSSSRRKLEGQIGESSREVVLRTVNGNVSLLRAHEAASPSPSPSAPPPPPPPRRSKRS